MPQPTLSDTHIDRALTILSVGYSQDEKAFVHNVVFPPVPVSNKSDKYFIYNRGDRFRNQMQVRADGDPAAGAGYKITQGGPYSCEVWSLLKKIGDQSRANTDAPLQPDRDATKFLVQQALLNREVNWMSKYFVTGVWGYERAGTGGAPTPGVSVKAWDASGSDPVADVLAAKDSIMQNTGYEANVLVLGRATKTSLKTNAAIIDRLKYGQTAPGPVTVKDSDLQQLFEVDRVVTASAIQTTSGESITTPDSDLLPDTFSFIAPGSALLAYAAPSPGIDVPSAGYTFNWTGLMGGLGAGYRIKKYRWEVNSADHVEIDSAYDFGLIGKFLGAFFNGIVV